jgi:hypothetical protein
MKGSALVSGFGRLDSGTSLEHAVRLALEPREEISKEAREIERKGICSFKPIRRTQDIQIGLVLC